MKDTLLPKKRRVYELSFPQLDSPLVVQTLLRGEIFRSYSELGYPEREIPANQLVHQSRLENQIFRHACLIRPEGVPVSEFPAGIVTKTAHFVLDKSGFLENSDEQNNILQDAIRHCKSNEARGDFLIMHTFPQYGMAELEDMTTREWTRLVFGSVAIQAQLYGINAKGFILSEEPEQAQAQYETSRPQEISPIDENTVNQLLGLRTYEHGGVSQRPIIQGGGSISVDGIKTWGVGHVQ